MSDTIDNNEIIVVDEIKGDAITIIDESNHTIIETTNETIIVDSVAGETVTITEEPHNIIIKEPSAEAELIEIITAGPKGATGPQGPKGDPGPPSGEDYFATIEDLEAVDDKVDQNTLDIAGKTGRADDEIVTGSWEFTEDVTSTGFIGDGSQVTGVDAETVNGLTVETAVPVGAVFTDNDTIYDDTQLQAEVDLNTAKETDVNHVQIELPNVDNTSDIDKPVSTAQQIALDGKVDDSQVLTDVPAGAVFTDTVYDDSGLQQAVTDNTADIATNTTDIGVNATDIGINALAIGLNADDIANLTADDVAETPARKYDSVNHVRDSLVDPNSSNDLSMGLDVGSTWFNSLTGYKYICTDNTLGNAQWIPITNKSTGDMIWGSAYVTGQAYYKGEVVRDGDWTMICIADTTTDKPAPYPNGDPEFSINENVVAFTEGSEGSVVRSGQRYAFNQGGWVKSIRVMVPELSDDVTYRILLTNYTDPQNPEVRIINNPTLVEGEWATVAVGNGIITKDSVYVVTLEALNSGTSTTVTGGWTFAGDDKTSAPQAGEWYRDKDNEIRINKTDLDQVDRGTELSGIIPQTEMLFQETADVVNFRSFNVTGAIVDAGDYYIIPVEKIDDGGRDNDLDGGDAPLTTTGTIEIPVASSTKYVTEAGYWTSNPVDYADIDGYLTFNGSAQSVADDAFGIDIEFQRANISEDYDLVSYSGGSSSGSSGGGSGVTVKSYVTNVLDFGAIGDGVENDTAAIQAAVDSARDSADKKIVFFPNTSGAYLISSPIVTYEGVTLLGQNTKGAELSGIKPVPGYNGYLITSFDYGVTRLLRSNIKGLFLDGSATTLTAIAINAQESIIEECTIKNCYTYGIHLSGVGSGLTEQALNNSIKNNYLEGTGGTKFWNGIFIDYSAADTEIFGNYVEGCGDAALKTRGFTERITNNHFYDATYHILSEFSDDKMIASNYFEYSAKESIYFDGGSENNATLNTVIVGNTFRNINTGANAGTSAIKLANSNISSVAITSNAIRRDGGTNHTVEYFINIPVTISSTDQMKIVANTWQENVVTTAETNHLPLTTESALDDLTDVDTTTVTPVDGDVLAYKNSTGNFEPVSVSGGVPEFTVITTPTVAALAKKSYAIDVTAADCVVTAPTKKVGDWFVTGIYGSSADSGNKITLTSTDKIMGSDEDFSLNTNWAYVYWSYLDDTVGWVIVNAVGETEAPNAISGDQDYVATAGQTQFAITYDIGFVHVYQNGTKLSNDEFVATSGTFITLNTPAALNDKISLIAYNHVTVSGIRAGDVPTDNTGDNNLFGADVQQNINELAGMLGAFVGSEVNFPVTDLASDAGFVLKDGSLLNRDAYPALWEWAVRQGLVVTEAEWQEWKVRSPINAVQLYSSGDDTTSFRIPTVGNGGFVRSWGVEGYDNLSVEKEIGFKDTVGPHTHDYKDYYLHRPDANYGNINDEGQLNYQNRRTEENDGSETRPKGYNVNTYIYAGNTTSYLPAPSPEWLAQQDTNTQEIAANALRITDLETGSTERFGIAEVDWHGSYYTQPYLGTDGKVYMNGEYNLSNIPRGGVDLDAKGFHYISLDYTSGVKDFGQVGHEGYVLMNDGRLYSWGYNIRGTCGVGNTAQVQKPTLVRSDVDELYLTSHLSYEHNYHMTYIRTFSGDWMGWGGNSSGRMGDGSTGQINSPTLLGALPDGTDIVQLFNLGASIGCTFVTSSGGKLYACGYNGYGELGTGVAGSVSSWTLVDASTGLIGSNIKDIQGGYRYYSTSHAAGCTTVFLTTDGDVYTSGYNAWGSLGNGTIGGAYAYSPFKVSVANVDEIICQGGGPLSIICSHTDKQSVTVWGYNDLGQLGIGSNTSIGVPTNYALSHKYIVGNKGGSHTYQYETRYFMVTDTDELWAVGDNGYGVLLNGVNDTNSNIWTRCEFYEKGIKNIITTSSGDGRNAMVYLLMNDGRLYGGGYGTRWALTGILSDAATVTSSNRLPLRMC